ncbi:hypothetical protein [Paenibacillus monticola]|uniref:Uncharacterized protein n=1 Tax=Paenibacillus monticola TaxID=2666075 RepID=A0A7X2HAX4_9BACL|nr:hypothetical protein [Paenibacillus monticola]MRN56756.1 hypothetical protein [Paenibacillus monticola]
MSKDKVWNKGKHNGRGLVKKDVAGTEATAAAEPDTTEATIEIPNPRTDTVKPMKRDNWVVRPTRVIPKNNK